MKQNQLRISDRGEEKTLSYTIKYAKGIYIVADNKTIISNCKALNIAIGSPSDKNPIVERVTLLSGFAIASTRTLHMYGQYIISADAEKIYVDQLTNDGPNKGFASLINAAYSALHNFDAPFSLSDEDNDDFLF